MSLPPDSKEMEMKFETIETLRKIGVTMVTQNFIPKAIRYYNRCFELLNGLEIQSIEEETECLLDLGIAYQCHNEHDRALECLRKCQEKQH